MGKRIFERRADQLFDFEAGARGPLSLPAREIEQSTGELETVPLLSPMARRGHAVNAVRQGTHARPLELFTDDCSEELRDAVIVGLGRVAPEASSAYAHALGHAGGKGALTQLRVHARKLRGFYRVCESGAQPRLTACLRRAYQAILRLNPDDSRAASQMERMYRAGEVAARARIATFINAVIESPPRYTAAALTLRSLVEEMLGDEDAVFVNALPSISQQFPERARSRAIEILRNSTDLSLRLHLIDSLARCGIHVARAIVEHYPQERSLELRVHILTHAFECIDGDFSARDLESAVRNESPYLRFQAFSVIRRMAPGPQRHALLAIAADEPDMLLARLLTSIGASYSS